MSRLSRDVERASGREPVDAFHEQRMMTDQSGPTRYNYPDLHAPRFRQIQADGPSKQDEQYDLEHDLTWVSKLRRNLREPFAEFLGVFIMICFGDGSVAQVNLSKNEFGEYQSISWCWVRH